MGFFIIFDPSPSPAGHNLIGNDCLLGVHFDVLNYNCLLATPTVSIERFGKQCDCPRSLIGKYKIFCAHLPSFVVDSKLVNSGSKRPHAQSSAQQSFPQWDQRA